MKTIAAIFTAAAIATPAFADNVEFSYSKSDLATSSAIASLYERIVDKADRACNSGVASSVEERRISDECAAGLTAQLVDKVDSAQLTALHEKRRSERVAASR